MLKKSAAAVSVTAAIILTAINASAESQDIFLSHSTGYYDNTQFVSVINSDGTDVYYTTDGSKPGKDNELYDGTPIIIEENTVVRMAAYSDGEVVSTAKSSIKIRTSAPSASVEGGEYSEGFKVKLSCPDDNAVIYYTTDGSVPTKESKVYKKALTISETTTLRFAAFAPDRSRSRVVTEKYVISEEQFADPLCQKLFELVNQTREEYGLSPLRALPALTEAAQIRAKEYSCYNSHYRPDGSRWDTILSAVGLKSNIRAENLAYYYTSAKAVLKCWMNDPFHRGNILNPDAEYIGLACYYNGWTNYWCQLFLGGE